MVDRRPRRASDEEHAKAEQRRQVSDAALVAIRRGDSVVICFESTLDALALEAVVGAEQMKAPTLHFRLERARRKVRITASRPRNGQGLEACVRALGGEAPLLDMS